MLNKFRSAAQSEIVAGLYALLRKLTDSIWSSTVSPCWTDIQTSQSPSLPPSPTRCLSGLVTLTQPPAAPDAHPHHIPHLCGHVVRIACQNLDTAVDGEEKKGQGVTVNPFLVEC